MAFGGLRTTFKNSAVSIGTLLSATGSQAVKLGDLIFVLGGEQTTLTIASVSDNLGNTYNSCDNSVNDAGTSTGRTFWARVKDNGTLTTVDMVANGGTSNGVIVVAIIEGPITNAIDKNPANITSDISSPFACPTSGTLSQANEIVIGWLVGTGSTVVSASSPNLLADQQATASVLHGAIGYQAVTATTAVAPEFTAGSNPTDQLMGTATFRRDDTPLGPGRPLGMQVLPNSPFLVKPPSFWSWTSSGLSLSTFIPPDTTNLPSVAQWGPPPPALPRLTLSYTLPFNLPLNTVVAVPFNQLSWPKPRPVAVRDGTWLNPGIRDVAGVPFNQTNWPNPRPAPPSRLGFTFSQQIQDTNVYLPSVVVDWSILPPAPRPQPFSAANRLPLASASVQLPFNQYNWPNPRPVPLSRFGFVFAQQIPADTTIYLPSTAINWSIAPPAPRPQSFVATNTLPLTSVEYVFRAPLFSKEPLVPPRIPQQPVNLLPLTAPVVAAPFNQTSWPNPKPLGPRDLSWTQSPHVLQRPNIQPFNKTDWPNQKAPTLRDLTWLNPSLDIDTIRPFVQSSWPNPKGFALKDGTWINQGIRDEAATPFNQESWPTPTPLRPPVAFIVQNSLPLNTVTEAPFNQTSWPNPTAPVRLTALFGVQNTLPLSVTVAPFSQLNWPNPRQAPSQGLTWLGSTFALLSSIEYPFRQTSWPNPLPPILLPNPGVRANFLPLATFVNTKPFNKSDWPLPSRLGPQAGYQLPLNLPLNVPPPPPPVGYEWLQRARRRGRR